ncbi:MAG TPA: hypothetical protein VHE58_10935 [Burkholderiales bacterium]|nr:hypothetical protein [Burkholderiales bacterium]
MKTLQLKVALIVSAFTLGLGVIMPWSTAVAAEEKFDPSAFSRGAQAWANNCARCHNMRDPKDFRDDEWKVIMSHMRIRAGLTGQEARDILQFLQRSN